MAGVVAPRAKPKSVTVEAPDEKSARAAADESAASGETSDLLGIWDRACRACDRYIVRREFAVGIMLGYYRWHTRADGGEEIVPTDLESFTPPGQAKKEKDED